MRCLSIRHGSYCENVAEDDTCYCTSCREAYGQSYWVKRPAWFIDRSDVEMRHWFGYEEEYELGKTPHL